MKNIRFHLDRISQSKAYGWARDDRDPSRKLRIDVAVNGAVMYSDYANVYRQDLYDLAWGDGAYGFEIYLGTLAAGELALFVDGALMFSTKNTAVFKGDFVEQSMPIDSVINLPQAVPEQLEALLSQRQSTALFLFGITSFYPRIQRHQQLAYMFAQRGWDVFFIEPIFRAGESFRFERLDARTHLYSLILPTQGQRTDFIGAYFDKGVLDSWSSYLSEVMGLYSVTHCVWGAPQWWPLMCRSLPFDTTIFDYIDDYGATFGQPHLRELLQRCIDHVQGFTYTSARLPMMEGFKKKKHSQIRNAYSTALIKADQPHAKPATTLGYVGAIDAINGDGLLQFLSANQALATIMGSGSLDCALSDLARRRKDIVFLGEVSHRAAMSQLSNCCFGMTFFRSQEIAQWVNPVKVYEYIALGMPVLSSHEVDVELELRSLLTVLPHSSMVFSMDWQNKLHHSFWQIRRQLNLHQYSWTYRCEQMQHFLETF